MERKEAIEVIKRNYLGSKVEMGKLYLLIGIMLLLLGLKSKASMQSSVTPSK